MKTLLNTLVITGLISASSCACLQSTNGKPAQDMDTLAKQLLGLTGTVDATLQDPATAGLSDQALLERSIADRPDLQSSFKDYKVTITRAGNVFSVLVCTRDGAHALLEDASCTVKLDRKLWQESPSAVCQPTLQLAAVCKLESPLTGRTP